MAAERVHVTVLVKAAPVMTRALDETMCVAGALHTGPGVEWIRLHPVPFRDLASDSKFVKYQEIAVDVIPSATDRRPETRVPVAGSISPGAALGTADGWAARRGLVDQLEHSTMCGLIERNRGGSGRGTTSLAVVTPEEPPELLITSREPAWITEWQRRAVAAKRRVSLFDDPDAATPDFEVVPWRFRYRYRCGDANCNSHSQTIIDWEAFALWRHVRFRPNWRELVTDKFQREMWQGRATKLFVGNVEQYPMSFLVLGVFWPPDRDYQLSLEV